MTSTDEIQTRWTIEAIDRLRALAGERVTAEVIAQSLHRPMTEVLAKAAELGIALDAESRVG